MRTAETTGSWTAGKSAVKWVVSKALLMGIAKVEPTVEKLVDLKVAQMVASTVVKLVV